VIPSLPEEAPAEAAVPPNDDERPGVLTALAVLDILVAMIALIPAAMAILLIGTPGITPLRMALTGLATLVAGLAVVAATGVLQVEEYGRRAQIALLAVGMLLIPVGTLVSVLLWSYLGREQTRLLFSGKAHLRQSSAEAGGTDREAGAALAAIAVAIVVAGVFLLGLIAAMAVT